MGMRHPTPPHDAQNMTTSMMASAATSQRFTPSPRLARRAAAGCNRRVNVVAAASRGRRGEINKTVEGDSDSDGSIAAAPNRRALLGGAALTAAASTFLNLGPAAPEALALFNKDLDVPITDPEQAVATVFGGGKALLHC